MSDRVTNVFTANRTQMSSPRDEPDFDCLDLSGEHLGVRIEALPPGSLSSYHHYHTAEEEHVLILEGHATLHLGDEIVDMEPGDHVCFLAGEEQPHHLENASDEMLTYLVFGERKAEDVVMYPRGSVAMVKSSRGRRFYSYQDYEIED